MANFSLHKRILMGCVSKMITSFITKIINKKNYLSDNKEELTKFIIGMLFLIIVHYQMVLQQQDKFLSISNNIEKIKESIDILNQHNELSKNTTPEINKINIDNINLAKPQELNLVIEDLLKLYFLNSKYLLNFTYFIKSKQSGLIEISYQSDFKSSKSFLENISKYKKLIKLNYVKITNNQTKMEVQVIYDKSSQNI